jgi:parallel beta-helix repeat protein
MELPYDGLGRGREQVSKVIVFTMVLVAVLILGTIAGMTVQFSKNGEQHPSETPVKVSAGLFYTAHGPIFIDGNGGFTNASGVVWGSGTASDPYIISDWEVNASSVNGISIWATNAHFIVRNCYVHDGRSLGNTYYGIYLLNCVNGTLEGNKCSDNYNGIQLESSSNNTLVNNSCRSSYGDGVCLFESDNNTLYNNTCSSNLGLGVALGMIIYSSSNNTLINNFCSSNNYFGIYVFYNSNRNILSNNNCSNDSDGIYLDSSSKNMLVNNTCSSNKWDGIQLYLSSNNTVVNNSCSSNHEHGIDLQLSGNDHNEISQNLFCNNVGYGADIESGSNNRIWNNTFIGNNGATSTHDASHPQAVDDGTGNWWNGTDGRGNYWSDWTTPDANHDGIVDLPYDIAGSAGAQDNYPLTTVQTQIPEFGMIPFVVIAFMAVIVLAREPRRKKKSGP